MVRTQETRPWHALEVTGLVSVLKSNTAQGLLDTEAAHRLEVYGQNRMQSGKKEHGLFIFLRQLKSPLVVILALAGVVSFTFGELGDATIVGITILVNAIVGMVQEGRASKAFARLQERITHKIIILRNGVEKLIDASSVVPGDVLLLRAGDYIPADARVLVAEGLRINESVLTGEWIAVDKSVHALSEHTPLLERVNMAWAGTLVEEGTGRALVVNTGAATEFGKIGQLVVETQKTKTPLQQGVERVARLIGIFVAFVIVGVFIIGVVRGEAPREMFLTAVAVAVAAVPEGLPIAVTVILALGMERILRRGGLVRHLMATETLGSTNIILTDKTGTLTQARMEVSEVVTGIHVLDPGEEGPVEGEEGNALALKIGVLTTDAIVENPEADVEAWVVRGSPAAKALLVAGARAGINRPELMAQYPRMDFLAFKPERRFSASLHKVDGAEILYVTGAPEVLLDVASKLYVNGKIQKLSPHKLELLHQKYESASRAGAHVLAVGFKEGRGLEKKEAHPRAFLEDLVFVGFVGFHDPLRKDVPEAIASSKQAGLRSVIVTGDHQMTAQKIAQEIGLVATDDRVMDGAMLESLSVEALAARVEGIDVYARVLPHQKLKIVEAWQTRGMVVAMTGDGVNDAPALKRADVGVALESGTDVAKEAADIVLLQDSFSILVHAIEEGRVILDNLRKLLTYLFATGFTEIVLIGGALVLGYPLPLFAAHILWTNLVHEGLLNFAFAFEPKEADVMRRRPDPRGADIFTPEMWRIILIVGGVTSLVLLGLFISLYHQGYPLELVRTMTFAGLATSSLFFTFSLRSLRRPLWAIPAFSNVFFLISICMSIGIFALAFAIPSIRALLGLVAIPPLGLALLVLLGIINVLAIELGKWFFVRRRLQA